MWGAGGRWVGGDDDPVVTAVGGGFAAVGAGEFLLEAAETNARAATVEAKRLHPSLKVHTIVNGVLASASLLRDVAPHDLVVVGSGRHQGAAAFWLGNTARAVVHESPCPVVVVHGSASRGRPERVVVGIDGSDASGCALDWPPHAAAVPGGAPGG